VFFKPEYRVAPFYFKVKREEITLREFLLEYATTFFRQYIAYCHQDSGLFNSRTRLEQLLELPSTNKVVHVTKKFIEAFMQDYYHERPDTRNQWDGFIKVPEQLGSYSGIRVAVIIDEFQEMKFYIHNVDEQALKTIRTERERNPHIQGTDLTATYDRQAQSRKAPMLVSGSAVTLIFRTVMGGPLGGRFDFTYLRPLSVPDGAALLRQLLEIYSPKTTINPENALYASAQVGGHPYYLYCLAMSKYEDKAFSSSAVIDKLIQYEVQQGKIFGFWQTHFQDNRQQINADSDDALGKKIIYYFTKYNNQPVEIKEIAEKLNVPKKDVEDKIEKLYLADLVWRTKARYYAFNDICLMRFIKFVYEKDLEDVEEIDLSQQGLVNNLKGNFLELVVQVTMMKFNHEILDGQLFGKSGTINVPLFQVVNTKYVKGSKTRSYQIDVFGRGMGGKTVWICECKYTQKKMGIQAAQKLSKAADALKQESEEAGHPVPEIRMWLISTGGFTQSVLDYAKDREDIYVSDHDGINGIFRAFGGNYDIPVFVNA
jgi:predicted transcriptional regulator